MAGKLMLDYTDKNGTSVRLYVTLDEAERRMKVLRRKAVLRNLDEMVVGGVEPAEGQDDQRIKWMWWIDKKETTR